MDSAAPVAATDTVTQSDRAPFLQPGTLLLAVLWCFPLLWAVGVVSFIWLIVAAPLLLSLLLRDRVVLPPGAAVWLLFLALMVPSGLLVLSSSTGFVWTFRFAIYASSGIIFVYAYNLDRRTMPVARMTNAFAVYWAAIVAGGLAALIVPNLAFPGLLESLLPAPITNQQFIAQLIEVRVSQVQDFLGFDVARPTAPFVWTNDWGANLAVASATFVAWAVSGGTKRRLVALAAGALAILPVVQSLNRGLWLGLGTVFVYAAVRQAARRDVRQLLAVVGVGAALVLTVVVSPVGDLVSLRADEGHSDGRRLDLYTASIDATLDSPLLGNGGTVVIETLPADAPPAGTHGQVWLLLVSHGVPATLAFYGFFGIVLWRTRAAPSRSLAFWTNVMFVVAIVLSPVYDLIPGLLPVMMLAAGIALREEEHRQLEESGRSVLPMLAVDAAVAAHAAVPAVGARAPRGRRA